MGVVSSILAPRRRWFPTVLALAACGGEGGVTPRVPAAVVIEPAEPRVAAYDSLQLTATVVDFDGVAIPGAPVVFSLWYRLGQFPDDSLRAAVSTSGMLRCLGPIANAYVRAQSGSVDLIAQIVCMFPRSAIWVWPIAVTLRVGGDEGVLFATVTDAQGIPSTLATINFASTDPTIATVGPTNGRIHAESPGTTTVVVSSLDRADVVVQVEVVP